MLAHTKKRPTRGRTLADKPVAMIKQHPVKTIFKVSCPSSNITEIRLYLENHGCKYIDDEPEYLDAKGLFAERTPANMLIGARGKENLTQIQLAELTGIPRRHISDMENGRRTIGKQNAMKLGKALNISYQLFL